MSVSSFATCDVCPRACRIAIGERGFCGARGTVSGPGEGHSSVVSLNYGKLTAISLDPIEKKPLRRFHSGQMILSVGSFGCNLNCPWCQNHHIARAVEEDVQIRELAPEELVKLAEEYVPLGNIGLAFTYNEPLISYEYVRDTSKILKERGLKSVLVTNGYIKSALFSELIGLIDAMNIDLKSVKKDFYKKIGGDPDTVMKNIKLAAEVCHVEITCLLINGENDTEDEMEEMTDFIASVSSEIPLHISRFFPRYKWDDRRSTDIEMMERFKEIADKKLKYVYLGNI